ncbi:hypothetical protein DdX_05739 [Ditylenchus destructor]|uniref:Uncharacterized protein n=1 Tax=Ditylenchus destructor TaxID=166010 RepID=A0AAD4NA81_9BILA|nr:hypothetical protein DdX_05739 [Ditylenchus destructor]
MPGSSRRFAPLGSRHGPHNVNLIAELLIGLFVRRGLRPLQRTLKMAYISHFKLNALRPNNLDVCDPMYKILVPFVLSHRELTFDTSLAPGGGKERKIPRYAPGQISPSCMVRCPKFQCQSFCLTESYHLTPHSPLEMVRNARYRTRNSVIAMESIGPAHIATVVDPPQSSAVHDNVEQPMEEVDDAEVNETTLNANRRACFVSLDLLVFLDLFMLKTGFFMFC